MEEDRKRIRLLDVIAVGCIVLCLLLLYGMLRPNMQPQEQLAEAPTRETTVTASPTEETQLPETVPTEAVRIPDLSALEQAEEGDTLFFGSFEQDGITDNGPESIEWTVLKKEEGRLLLISSYALDWRPYHPVRVEVTWEECLLRKWLNEDFLTAAFTEAEQGRIPEVTVSPGKNPNFYTDPGNATQDRIFLLSPGEASIYGLKDRCPATAYAVNNGADAENSRWWLRAPGTNQNNAAWGYYNGGYYIDDCHVNKRCAVRPAMWIELETP